MLAVVTALAYGNASRAGLLFDSASIVGADWRLEEASWTHVHAILTKDYWAGATAMSGLYRPLTTLSYWVQKAVLGHGTDPGPYVYVNIGLHAANAILLCLFLHRVGVSLLVATFSASIFAVHPLGTEAVTNVVGRADLLGTLAVLAVLCLHRAAGMTQGWGLLGLRTAQAAIFLAGILAKESAVVAIALMVAHDLAFAPAHDAGVAENLGGGWKARITGITRVIVANRWILVVLVLEFALIWWWRIAVVGLSESGRPAPTDNPIAWAPFLPAQLTSICTILLGIWLTLWPQHLSAEYGFDAIPVVLFPPAGLRDGFVVLGAIGLAAWAAGAVWRLQQARLWAFLSLAWFIALAPVSNFFVRIGTIFGERLLYLPSVFLIPLMVVCGSALALRVRSRLSGVGRAPGWLLLLLAVSLLAALGTRTYRRNEDWQSLNQLFASAAAIHPEAIRARLGLAAALMEQASRRGADQFGLLDSAWIHAEVALGVVGRLPEGQRPFVVPLRAAKILLQRADATGEAVARTADLEQACRLLADGLSWERAARADAGLPLTGSLWGDANLRNTMGVCLLRLGRARQALEYLEAAADRDPAEPAMYVALAETWLELGESTEAARAALQALILSPGNPEAFTRTRLAFDRLGLVEQLGGSPGAPRLVADDGRVRQLLDAACVGVYKRLRPHDPHGRYTSWFRQRAVGEFGCDPALFAGE